MIIPFAQINDDTLTALIEDYVTRDGTDYGEYEIALSTKVAQLKQQLQRKEIVVVFDAASESVSLLTSAQAALAGL
jgi:uncharacterized protein YheU (UPF0270 family)